MQQFYLPSASSGTQEITFDKRESRHIIKVLRKKIGDQFHITNGKGLLFLAELAFDNPNECVAKIIDQKHFPKRDFHLHIGIAPTKQIDRFEWFLEKATEIGIEEITPIICDRSERKIIKLERLQNIVLTAMKQSLNVFLPKLNPPKTFKNIIAQQIAGQKYIAHCENSDKKALNTVLKTKTDCLILIGPEGDFSPNEIVMALQNQFIPVTLGATRLRTETAALVACHTVTLKNQ